MTAYSYNNLIPAAPNNPSNDQPGMLTNAKSIASLISTDHIGFNSQGTADPSQGTGGQHTKVSFNGKNAFGSTPIDPLSILYTASGVASTVSDMRFQNNNGTFPVNLIRAWGISDSAGNIVASQSINVVGPLNKTSTGRFTVTLTTGAVNSTKIGVIISAEGIPSLTSTYSLGVTGTFDLIFNSNLTVPTDPTQFNFIVLQL
jgi:hypothetical protein